MDTPLCACCRTDQRRFLEHFSRFKQVKLSTEVHLQPVQVNYTDKMNGVSAPLRSRNGKRPSLRLLACTANLGNEQPDAESIAKWIPPDGFFVEDTIVTDSDGSESNVDETESSATPYETKYPIKFGTDTDFLSDELLTVDLLSKQLDLIVIGLQEATFDPPKDESLSEGTVRIRVPQVKTFKKLQTLRAAKDHSISESERQTPTGKSSTLSPSNAIGSIRTALRTINRDNWADGTHVLHSLFEGRLPSYTRLVSYQRGQMRLLVFGRTESLDPINDPPIPLKVLHIAAQNTGRAGLANKGGIVTEILANCSTRLSFVSCHLEAHEGASKYAIRCQTLVDILRGTAARKKALIVVPEKENDDFSNSAHHVLSSAQSSQHSYSNMAVDVTLTAHYSFVLGDLNFRTDLSHEMPGLENQEETHKLAVRNLVAEQNWERLNAADELHMALRRKDCLVGFRTLFCNFPPTFKVERQAGYQYVEKRRPSYTDRILFKTGHQLDEGIKPILYEPIDEFTTSDHKPVRAAFTLNLNEPFRVRPRAVRHQSIRLNRPNEPEVGQGIQLRRKLGSFFHLNSSRSNDNGGLDVIAVDNSSGQGLGRSGDSLYLFVSNISVILKKIETSVHGPSKGPPMTQISSNPYLVLMSQPEEALRLPYRRAGRLRRFIRRLRPGLPKSTSERTKHGWPCTSRKNNTYTANWDDEEIACKVVTHIPQGGSLDLTGAVLFLSVMNGRTVLNGGEDDTLMGTVTLNLANLVRDSRGKRSSSPMGMENGRENSNSRTGQRRSQHRRVHRTSIFGSVLGSRHNSRGSGDRGSSSGLFGWFGHNSNEDEDTEEPIPSVEINEPLLNGGVEVGVLSCTIESWWMDESTAKIIKVPATTPSDESGFTRFFQKKPKHRKTEKRAGFREPPRGEILNDL